MRRCISLSEAGTAPTLARLPGLPDDLPWVGTALARLKGHFVPLLDDGFGSNLAVQSGSRERQETGHLRPTYMAIEWPVYDRNRPDGSLKSGVPSRLTLGRRLTGVRVFRSCLIAPAYRKGDEPGLDNAFGLELELLFEPLFVSSDLRLRSQPMLD
jgi:hypothetical protein